MIATTNGLSRKVTILGTGVAVPSTILTAEELDRKLGIPAGESYRVTRIQKRHIVSPGQTAANLAAAAVKNALKNARLRWEDIDCLVCASATMDQALPYNAAMVMAEMPLRNNITTMDIGASCLSFLQAVDMVSCSIEIGRFKTVLIVSADISSFTTDFRNLSENGIFGDGAAAAILSQTPPGKRSRILATNSITLPQGVEYCRIRSGGSRYHRRGNDLHAQAVFEMDGRRVFCLARREVPQFVDKLLKDAGVQQKDIALFIPHQASQQSITYMSRKLGFADGRCVEVFSEFGNQVGASLPTALHYAIERYELQRGQIGLLLGSGAGVSVGGIVFEY